LPWSASAQEPDPAEGPTQDEVNEIAQGLYCPVCENVPLDVCPTQACADWRDEIRIMLSEGRTEAEIQDYFIERYGRQVLATPERQGFDLLVWLVPVLGVAVGAVVLVISLRRMAPNAFTAQAAQSALAYPDLDPEYIERLERDLTEFKT
jgi:cytochrome c-type biogenesis protein CcmH